MEKLKITATEYFWILLSSLSDLLGLLSILFTIFSFKMKTVNLIIEKEESLSIATSIIHPGLNLGKKFVQFILTNYRVLYPIYINSLRYSDTYFLFSTPLNYFLM